MSQRTDALSGPILVCLAILCGLGQFAEDRRLLAAETKTPDVSVLLHVTDENGQAVSGAELLVTKWTGRYEPLGEVHQTNNQGEAKLSFPFSDDFFYLLVRAESKANKIVDLHVDKDSTSKEFDVTLQAPTPGYVQVTANDHPVENAEFSWIEFTDNNGEKIVWTKDGVSMLDIVWPQSDAEGRLLLPLIPHDAILDFKVIHPDFRQVRLEGTPVKEGEIAGVSLSSGVPVVVTVESHNKDGSTLADGTSIMVQMFTSGATRAADTVYHPFAVRDGKVTFTASPEKYNRLQLTTNDFFLSPPYFNYSTVIEPRLDLTSGQEVRFEAKSHPKRTVRGRIVDPDGNGIPGAFISTSFQHAGNNEGAENEQYTSIEEALRTWTSAGNGETDAEGNFEVEAPSGTLQIEPICAGYFSDPPVMYFQWSGDPESIIPDYKLHRVPKLKGKVVDASGKPRSGVVARLRHEGRGDADPVVITDANGEFELQMRRIPYSTKTTNLQTNLGVLAFDPHSNQAGLTTFEVTDEAATQSIVVTLSEQPVGWLRDPYHTSVTEGTDTEWEEQVAQNRKQYAQGLPGKTVPDMRDGTWLNTEAKSLEDFRGKYVLLDFWFIGCGPCARDQPSVHAAYEAYRELGFTVVAMHINGQTAETVAKYARENNMDYPIFVDDPEGTVTKQFRELGVNYFPMYILLGPDGKIIHNDVHALTTSLRGEKLELIHEAIHSAQYRPKGN